MRIPFIPRVADPTTLVSVGRAEFIRDTKGGSAFLFAGGVFWLLGALISAIAPSLKVDFVLWGGLLVPVLGFLFGRLQGAHFTRQSPYTSLAAIAPIVELAAIPIMLFLRDITPAALPGILMLLAGAHLLIYMWLHLDYSYYLAFNSLALLGMLFMFGAVAAGSYPIQMSAAGVISIVAGILVWRDSGRTLELYRKS